MNLLSDSMNIVGHKVYSAIYCALSFASVAALIETLFFDSSINVAIGM